jgi:hypothetical protein
MDSKGMYGKLTKIKSAAKDIEALVELGIVTTQRRDRLRSPIAVPASFYQDAEKIYENIAAMKLETLSLITHLERDYQNPEHPTEPPPPRKFEGDSAVASTPERSRDDG